MDYEDFSAEGEPQVYKIIYLSQINIAGGSEDRAREIRNILTWSRAWNPRHGVTGALLLNDQNFTQVIEGPSDPGKDLFGHIVCDKRHQNVQLLQAGLFMKRDFPSWSMAYAGQVGEADIKLASDPRHHSEHFVSGARSTMALLRWLLLEERFGASVR